MDSKQTLKIALRGIVAHKSRSALTVLGIVIGIVSIILIVSIGDGVKGLITDEITSLGADIVWIEPGREPQGPTDFATTAFSNTLKDRDIEALKKKSNVPLVADVAPAISVPGSVSYEGETYRPFIMGFSGEFMGRVFNIYPEEGVYFDEVAIRNREKVVVIGAKVKDELFGESDAVGKNIRIKNDSFRVVGVLPDEGQIFFFDLGDMVVVPYSTARTYLLGIDYYNEVWVQVEDAAAAPSAVEDIKSTLREMHGITDPKKDDFYVMTQESLLKQVSGIVNILTFALSFIVAIALLVGGVGVMNIMLVSVTERTREIGLRKAVGATNKDILNQFLLEAVTLTAIGGAIGIFFGALLSFVAAFIATEFFNLNLSFVFPVGAALLSFGSAALIGLVFGIYPARQAARKDPIEALRYE
ncbi:MAG: ABC transporter permease [Candidatus Jorgensenbacteria bacterium]